jgi:phosphopantetheinyl transferase
MPLKYAIEITSSVSAGVWHITESAEELMTLVLLDDDDRFTCESFKSILRKKQWLGCRALIQQMLDKPDSKLIYDSNGKPMLASGSHHISVSHAGDYAAAVISDLAEVGIDIEQLRPRIERVKERFLSTGELSQLPAGYSLENLYYLWCSKEALYKMHGLPGVDFLNDIRIHPIDYFCTRKGMGRATLLLDEATEEHLLYYERREEWMLVVAY